MASPTAARRASLSEPTSAYIARLQVVGQDGLRQEIGEFTREDITNMLAKAPEQRRETQQKKG